MTTIQAPMLQQLSQLTRGQTLQKVSRQQETSRIQQTQFLVTRGDNTLERITLDQYLKSPESFAVNPDNTQLQIYLDTGEILTLPLAELKKSTLLEALKRASHSVDPLQAKEIHHITSDLVQEIRTESHRPSAQALYDFTRAHFQVLDKDQDGWITADELKSALHNPRFHAFEKAILNRMLANIGELEEYSNDEWGDENDGITLRDLEVFLSETRGTGFDTIAQSITGEVNTASKQSARAYQLFCEHFHEIDSDQDGYITPEDLRQASRSGKFPPAFAEWLSKLAAQVGEIEELSNDEWGDENDGITLKDMEVYVKLHADPMIQFPFPGHQDISGNLSLKIQDSNGFDTRGKGDISGQISGRLTLDRSLIDQALAQLPPHINNDYIKIHTSYYDPREKAYFIELTTPIDDFKIGLHIHHETGMPYLELSENWIPDDLVLKEIQKHLKYQLDQLKIKMQLEAGRIAFQPEIRRLSLPLADQVVDLDTLSIKPENLRFDFDAQGNLALHIQPIQINGSTGSTQTPPDRAPDRAEFDVAIQIDLSDWQQTHAPPDILSKQVHVKGQAILDIESPEEAQTFMQALNVSPDIDLKKPLEKAILQLLYGQVGQVQIQMEGQGQQIGDGAVKTSISGSKLLVYKGDEVIATIDLAQMESQLQNLLLPYANPE